MRVGSYLRGARERQHLTIGEISELTKIKYELLVDLENNDLSRWPRHRVYRHGYLRSYAEAVGLDPKTVLEEFDAEFGDPFPAAFHGPPTTTLRHPPVPLEALPSAALVSAIVICIGVGLTLTLINAPAYDVSSNRSKVRQPQIAGNVSDVASRSFAASPQTALAPTAGNDDIVASTSEVQAPDTEMTDIEASDIEGELRIVSKPANAHVTVNGIGRGETPLRVRYLPLGSYTIRVVQPGYKIGQTVVTLRPDQPSRTVRVVLRDSPMFARSDASNAISYR
jgi:cytoskeletal protein RodZ